MRSVARSTSSTWTAGQRVQVVTDHAASRPHRAGRRLPQVADVEVGHHHRLPGRLQQVLGGRLGDEGDHRALDRPGRVAHLRSHGHLDDARRRVDRHDPRLPRAGVG